jgi:hypothetical protein
MDFSTEPQFKERLRRFAAHKTMMIVTHRTSLIDLATRIIVVDDGRIVADGPREQVVEALQSGQGGEGAMSASPRSTLPPDGDAVAAVLVTWLEAFVSVCSPRSTAGSRAWTVAKRARTAGVSPPIPTTPSCSRSRCAPACC